MNVPSWQDLNNSIRFYLRSKPLRTILVLFGLGSLTGLSLLFWHLSGNREPGSITEGKSAVSGIAIFSDGERISSENNKTRKIRRTLEKDETLFGILTENKITGGEILNLLVASKKVHDLNRIRPGNMLELQLNALDNTVNSLKYEIDEDSVLVLQKSVDGFSARKMAIEYHTRLSVKHATISNSLFETIIDAGLASRMAMDLAEIFAWDIDFSVDIRPGDRFSFLFEQKYRDGNFVRNGNILCAMFVNQGKTVWAIRFEDGDGNGDAGYYDLQGKSIRKKFLRSPLKYQYISSRYSKRRLHPILKTYRPHLGIDYAAPVGTPVVAVGDGRVLFAGWNGGYGKFVKIRHNGTYTSTYGHLSRFAKEVKRTKYIKQGTIIGYVGSTGLSTGPHLDYRLIKNGRFVNPLTCNFPSASPVREEYLKNFERTKEEMVAKLSASDSTLTSHDGETPGPMEGG